MSAHHWIELKRTDFLAAIRSIEPPKHPKVLREAECQIGLVNGQLVLAIQGASAVAPSIGHWPGIASVRLPYLLSFLVARPVETVVRIVLVGERLHIGSARIPARWADSNDLLTGAHLDAYAKSANSIDLIKFKCRKCRRKQGIAFASVPSGPGSTDAIKRILKTGEPLGHGFGCLVCGHTWDKQSV
jgi:hypothetical protein